LFRFKLSFKRCKGGLVDRWKSEKVKTQEQRYKHLNDKDIRFFSFHKFYLPFLLSENIQCIRIRLNWLCMIICWIQRTKQKEGLQSNDWLLRARKKCHNLSCLLHSRLKKIRTTGQEELFVCCVSIFHCYGYNYKSINIFRILKRYKR